MQLTQRTDGRVIRYDRIHHIETGYDIKAQDDGAADEELAMLLRRVHLVRENNPIEFKQIANRVFALESYSVRQRVHTAGLRQSGKRWVDQDAIDDVVSMAFIRLLDFLKGMEGKSIGEWRNGVKRCVQWAVADYIRLDQRHEAEPIDHGHFTDALSPEEQRYADVASRAASNTAEDRAIFKEKLSVITMLEPRAAEVLTLRLFEGYSSKEVAEKLGISPANVDQILSRTLKKIGNLGS